MNLQFFLMFYGLKKNEENKNEYILYLKLKRN